jgi:hypothetical protein
MPHSRPAKASRLRYFYFRLKIQLLPLPPLRFLNYIFVLISFRSGNFSNIFKVWLDILKSEDGWVHLMYGIHAFFLSVRYQPVGDRYRYPRYIKNIVLEQNFFCLISQDLDFFSLKRDSGFGPRKTDRI